MDIGLKGRIAVVTGAGSGVGREIVKLLNAEGAGVMALDIVHEKARETAALCMGPGPDVTAYRVDIINAEEVNAAAAEILSICGHIDILINNAGYGLFKPFNESNYSDWMVDINVNLIGTLNCTRSFINGMIGNKYGRIVNIVSDAGRVGEPYMTTYSAAKAAVAGFSKALAKEMGPHGIHVNCVALGTTKTPLMTPFLTSDLEKKIVRNYPLGRLGLPHEPARMAVFLASDAASWITGQVIAVNGGYSMI
jgi:NAD(P)-dependent dehydrogenase (short-subunit alcohol dehydrogenase family)